MGLIMAAPFTAQAQTYWLAVAALEWKEVGRTHWQKFWTTRLQRMQRGLWRLLSRQVLLFESLLYLLSPVCGSVPCLGFLSWL